MFALLVPRVGDCRASHTLRGWQWFRLMPNGLWLAL